MCGKQCRPDQTPSPAASHLGLQCLLRSVCSNACGYFGNIGYRRLQIYINTVIPSLPLLREGQLSVPGQRMFTILHTG